MCLPLIHAYIAHKYDKPITERQYHPFQSRISLLVNLEGVIKIANDQALKRLSYRKEELIGLPVHHLATAKSRKNIQKSITEIGIIQKQPNKRVKLKKYNHSLNIYDRNRAVLPVKVCFDKFITKNDSRYLLLHLS